MYTALLVVHSWMRWVVLLTALMALARAISGRNQSRPWTPADERAMKLFTIALDIQLLFGIVLYAFLSPVTTEAFRDMAAAMRNGPLRFWSVEHPTGMLVAIVLAHVGRVLVRKAQAGQAKHARAMTFTGLALLILLISIPWPGLPNGRTLFRFGG